MALVEDRRLLLWCWLAGTGGCVAAAVSNLLLGALLVSLAGALRGLSGYGLPGLADLLDVIPGWKYFVALYLLLAASVSLSFMGALSGLSSGALALLVLWPLVVPALVHDVRVYRDRG